MTVEHSAGPRRHSTTNLGPATAGGRQASSAPDSKTARFHGRRNRQHRPSTQIASLIEFATVAASRNCKPKSLWFTTIRPCYGSRSQPAFVAGRQQLPSAN